MTYIDQNGSLLITLIDTFLLFSNKLQVLPSASTTKSDHQMNPSSVGRSFPLQRNLKRITGLRKELSLARTTTRTF